MRIEPALTDEAVLSELGRRLERLRVDAALTQAELARKAGIAKRTLERIEAGSGCEFTSLIRVLRVLERIEELNVLVPELPPSPVALLTLQGRERQRVRSPRLTTRASKTTSSSHTTAENGVARRKSTWKWGE